MGTDRCWARRRFSVGSPLVVARRGQRSRFVACLASSGGAESGRVARSTGRSGSSAGRTSSGRGRARTVAIGNARSLEVCRERKGDLWGGGLPQRDANDGEHSARSVNGRAASCAKPSADHDGASFRDRSDCRLGIMASRPVGHQRAASQSRQDFGVRCTRPSDRSLQRASAPTPVD